MAQSSIYHMKQVSEWKGKLRLYHLGKALISTYCLQSVILIPVSCQGPLWIGPLNILPGWLAPWSGFAWERITEGSWFGFGGVIGEVSLKRDSGFTVTRSTTPHLGEVVVPLGSRVVREMWTDVRQICSRHHIVANQGRLLFIFFFFFFF